MKFTRAVHDEALKLYTLGMPMEEIARQLDKNGKRLYPSKVTLWHWYAVDKWAEKIELAKKTSRERLNEELTDSITEYKQAGRAALSNALTAIKEGKAVGRVSDIPPLIRVLAELEGKLTTKVEVSGFVDLLLKSERIRKAKEDGH